MNPDILMLFDKTPAALPLYQAAEAKIMAAFPDAKIKASKMQVGFSDRYGFAWLWPPVRRAKGWPRLFVGLTFGLSYRLEHPRIAVSVEPYPNRWTHHLLIERPDELDEEVMGWLREAYEFSMIKGRTRL